MITKEINTQETNITARDVVKALLTGAVLAIVVSSSVILGCDILGIDKLFARIAPPLIYGLYTLAGLDEVVRNGNVDSRYAKGLIMAIPLNSIGILISTLSY